MSTEAKEIKAFSLDELKAKCVEAGKDNKAFQPHTVQCTDNLDTLTQLANALDPIFENGFILYRTFNPSNGKKGKDRITKPCLIKYKLDTCNIADLVHELTSKAGQHSTKLIYNITNKTFATLNVGDILDVSFSQLFVAYDGTRVAGVKVSNPASVDLALFIGKVYESIPLQQVKQYFTALQKQITQDKDDDLLEDVKYLSAVRNVERRLQQYIEGKAKK